MPQGQGRVRLVFHAANTVAEVENVVALICEFAQAVLEEEAVRAKLQCQHVALHLDAAKKMASFRRADWDALLKLKGVVMNAVTEVDPEASLSDLTAPPESMLPEEINVMAGYRSGESISSPGTTPGLSTGLTERSTSSMGESMSSEDAVPETEGKLRKASFALEAWKLQQGGEDGAKKVNGDPEVVMILAEMAAGVSVGC